MTCDAAVTSYDLWRDCDNGVTCDAAVTTYDLWRDCDIGVTCARMSLRCDVRHVCEYDAISDAVVTTIWRVTQMWLWPWTACSSRRLQGRHALRSDIVWSCKNMRASDTFLAVFVVSLTNGRAFSLTQSSALRTQMYLHDRLFLSCLWVYCFLCSLHFVFDLL